MSDDVRAESLVADDLEAMARQQRSAVLTNGVTAIRNLLTEVERLTAKAHDCDECPSVIEAIDGLRRCQEVGEALLNGIDRDDHQRLDAIDRATALASSLNEARLEIERVECERDHAYWDSCGCLGGGGIGHRKGCAGYPCSGLSSQSVGPSK